MIKYLAQTVSTPFPQGFQGLGPLGGETSPGVYNIFGKYSATEKFDRIISLTLGVMTVVAGLWFIFQIFISAIEWLSSGGEKQHVENARKKITNSVIGLLIVVVSYGLILTFGNILGIKGILSPSEVIVNFLSP